MARLNRACLLLSSEKIRGYRRSVHQYCRTGKLVPDMLKDVCAVTDKTIDEQDRGNPEATKISDPEHNSLSRRFGRLEEPNVRLRNRFADLEFLDTPVKS